MNYSEFVREFAAKSNLTLKDAKEVAKAYEDVALSHARDDKGVRIFNSGLTISTKYMDERVGHNPATGDPVKIAARYKPVAKFGKAFKEMINY